MVLYKSFLQRRKLKRFSAHHQCTKLNKRQSSIQYASSEYALVLKKETKHFRRIIFLKENTEQVPEWKIMKGSPIVKISTEFFSKATFKAGHLCYSHNINNKKKHKGILKTAKEPSYYAIKYFYFCLTVT